jgi:AraC family transcriptional regulator
MTDDKPTSKYGTPLTGAAWAGFPIRVGDWPSSGSREDLTTPTDAILVWTGGISEVAISGRGPEADKPSDYAFRRRGGMVDLLPRGTELCKVSWEGEPQTCTSVNLPAPCLHELTDVRPTGLSLRRGPRFALIDAHVVDLTSRLQVQATANNPLGALYVQSLSLALAAYVTARYGDADPGQVDERGGLPTQLHRRVREFIEDHVSDDFGLLDLASLAGYSPDHFSRLFKKSFGLPPHQYVLTRRVERAKTLLRAGDLPISNVAHACGFGSQAHLTAAFKRRTGVTPGAYRRG